MSENEYAIPAPQFINRNNSNNNNNNNNSNKTHNNHNDNNFRRHGGGRGRGRGRGRGQGRGLQFHRGGNFQRREREGRGYGSRGGSHAHKNNNHRNNRRKENMNSASDVDISNLLEEIGVYKDSASTLRIAVQGCAHGGLDRIYDTLQAYQQHLQQQQQQKEEQKEEQAIDLLLCCGDFQSLRNTADLDAIAVPQKYKEMGSFHAYYAGIRKAPLLTIFIGGNHEASNVLQELYYGGWVAPNIYYLGAAGVVRYKGMRIAGLGGIYKSRDYRTGRHEFPPYDSHSLRSVYHVRSADASRLKCLSYTSTFASTPISVFLTHDWPRGIERFGDTEKLLRKKTFFREEVRENRLGSPVHEELLHILKPSWWFAAHLHVKFQAEVRHAVQSKLASATADQEQTQNLNQTEIQHKQLQENQNENHPQTQSQSQTTSFLGLESSSQSCSINTNGEPTPDLTDLMTRFLSLDKCLPRRPHLQIINVPRPPPVSNDNDDSTQNNDDDDDDDGLHYDLEWLAILKKTHHWTTNRRGKVPDPDVSEIVVSEEDICSLKEKLRERWVNKLSNSQDATATCADECDHDGHAHSNDQNINTTKTPTTLDDYTITRIPNNFTITVPPYGTVGSDAPANGGRMVGNPQTDELLHLLGLDHVVTVPYIYRSPHGKSSGAEPAFPAAGAGSATQFDEDEIDIDDDLDSNDFVVGDVGQRGIGNDGGTGKNIAHGREDENEIDIDDG